jgi:hypothetical protein
MRIMCRNIGDAVVEILIMFEGGGASLAFSTHPQLTCILAHVRRLNHFKNK